MWRVSGVSVPVCHLHLVVDYAVKQFVSITKGVGRFHGMAEHTASSVGNMTRK